MISGGTAECAHRLDDVALLSLDLRHGVVTIHDVMGEYLRQQTSDLAALHAQLVTGYGNVLRLPDAYAWGWLPYHLQRAGEIRQLRQLLLRPPWLQAQLRAIGAYAQLRAFEWVGEDRDLQLVRRALRLSLPALVADASQLCEQLLGRLPESVSAALDDFRRELLQMAPIPRLHGRWRNLIGPGSLIQTLSHNAGVAGVLELSDGRLLSWSADGTLRVWDLETGKGHSLAGHERGVNGAIVLADNRVLSWSDDHSLRVWDLTIGQSRPLTGHQDVIDGALALPGGRALSWSRDATLRVWDLETGEGHALVGHEERVTGALMLRDGRAVSWGWDNSLRVWDLSTGQGRAVTGGEQVTDALILPDGRVLSWGWDHMLRIWDFATGQSRTLTGHTDAVEGAMVLPNGRVLSWSRDGTSRLWDLETGTGDVVSGETRLVGPLVPSDGRLLSRDGKRVPTIWDLATGQARPLNGDGRTKRAMLESQTTE